MINLAGALFRRIVVAAVEAANVICALCTELYTGGRLGEYDVRPVKV